MTDRWPVKSASRSMMLCNRAFICSMGTSDIPPVDITDIDSRMWCEHLVPHERAKTNLADRRCQCNTGCLWLKENVGSARGRRCVEVPYASPVQP
jgi:hypothetical protein